MNILSWIMLLFCILGGIDRILGNRFGLGQEFEKGFTFLGNLCLTMVGMISLAPLMASALAPCFAWVYDALKLDPSVIPALLLASDMGGAPLAVQIAQEEKMGLFNGLVVASMMGCTLSYSIPYALGVVKKEHHKDMLFGILCGIVTIPLGCFVTGLVYGIGILALLWDLLPLVLFSAAIVCGLLFFSSFTVKLFSWLGILVKTVITLGLLLAIFQFLTGIELVRGLGDIREGAQVCFNAAIVLSGAFPFMYVVSRLLTKPMEKLGKALGISSRSAMGLVGTIVTNATTCEAINHMEPKGVVLNSAFMVSAAFTFGGHLAFTMSVDPSWLPGVMLGKLVAGLFSVALALVLYKRVYRNEV